MNDKPEVRPNFLLRCSENTLDNFRLERMSAAANLRKELHAVLDKLIEEMLQVKLALWFKETDRAALKRALETDEGASMEDILAWARREIRGHDILPRLRMDPEERRKRHREAAKRYALENREASKRYQKEKVAAGLCRVGGCGEPLCRESVNYCTLHLEKSNSRQRERMKKLGKAPHGRHPNSLAVLAAANKARKEGGA
jgi:hypothetical protein